MEQPLRVAIYARVSTEEQAEYGYSIDAQLDTLKNYCQLYNKQIVDEYVDRGVSGKSMKGRYELQRLLLDAKEGRFDEVLVWKINRMARKNIDLLQIVDILDKHNIAFRSFSENFETATSMGRFALQMMGAVGELERNTIVDNVKMGHKQRAKTGRHNGKVPLGYRIVEVPGAGRGKNSQIVIVEEEASLVRKIFEMYAGGHGLRAIANSLNQQGYTTKRNNTFSSCAVRDILDNSIFVGKIRYNQYENWAEKRRKGKTETPILVQGHHPAIIADDLWEKVELLRKKKSKMPKKRFEGEYLLTGLIRCPECGAAMTASRTVNQMRDGTKVTRMYYSCGRFKSQGSSVCHANSIRKVEAEKAVTQRIQGVLTKPALLKAIVRNVNERKTNRIKPLQDELNGVNARISKLEESKRRYLGLYEIDRIDRDLFADRLNDLNSDLDTELTRKAKLELELRDDQAEPISYEIVRSLIERFDHLLQHAPFPQRKTLLHLVVKKISLDDKRQVQDVELIFNEETEKHFLSLAPSAESMAEGAFPIYRKSISLEQSITITV